MMKIQGKVEDGKQTYEENWIDCHSSEGIMHLNAGFEGFVRDGWTDRLEKAVYMVGWYLGEV